MGASEGHEDKGNARRGARMSFGARLMVTFTLTLLALSVGQYVVALDQLQRRLAAHSRIRHEAMLDDISTSYERPGEGRKPMEGVGLVLSSLIRRPDVKQTFLVRPDGTVAGAPYYALVGSRLTGRAARLVAAAADDEMSKRSFQPHPTHEAYEYALPVTLDAEPYVLYVVEEDRLLRGQLLDVRARSLMFLGGGLLLGVPLFYLLGGRSLSRNHQLALDRSSRDPLTGLGNHRAFQDELRRATAVADRHGHPLSLVLLDLDDFKQVNDRGGHRQGDQLLVDVARLFEADRPEDRSFRIGGDEFAVLLPFADSDGSWAVGDRMRRLVEERFSHITVSIGVAELGRHARSADGLRECADIALYEAKRRGRNTVVAFQQVEVESSIVTTEKTMALRTILDGGAVSAAFQPIFELSSLRPLGYEGLTRPDDGYGLADAADAFATAETLGRVHDLDALCRQTILGLAGDLPAEALLFLNVSPRTLGHASMQGDRLKTAIEQAGLEPARVVLEITQRVVADRGPVARELTRLRELGFRTAVDDVGVGSAGLQFLRHVPADYVKIHGEVVTSACHDLGARAVLRAILAFAAETGAKVIAEGIETPEVLRFVQSLRSPAGPAVHGVQGYLLARPADIGALAAASVG